MGATMKPIAASEALQGQEFWSKNKRLARPMSPHLTIYKPQLTSMMSITHRITGCVQSGILSGAALGVLIMPVNFPILLNEIQQLQLGGLTIFSLKSQALLWPCSSDLILDLILVTIELRTCNDI